MKRFSSKLFDWNEKTKTFVTEASTLMSNEGTLPGNAFKIVSARTNKEAIFTYIGSDRNDEGEITGWRYTSGPDLIEIGSKVTKASVLVIND